MPQLSSHYGHIVWFGFLPHHWITPKSRGLHELCVKLPGYNNATVVTYETASRTTLRVIVYFLVCTNQHYKVYDQSSSEIALPFPSLYFPALELSDGLKGERC